jgi:hypothetical protein
MDLHPYHPAPLEGHAGQRARDLRREPAPDVARPDPVADLERLGPDPAVKASASEKRRPVRLEHAVDPVVAPLERVAELAQPAADDRDRLRRRPGPVHELPQMLEAGVDRLLDARGRRPAYGSEKDRAP